MKKTFLLLLTMLLLTAAHLAAETPKYISPMHPFITSDEPGQCPICGMDLVPYEQFESGGTGSIIEIDPVVVQNMGVRLAQVERGELNRNIRTVGIVGYEEAGQTSVNSKIAGWVEQLHVNQTGQEVKKGQLLLSIYSPDLVSAQEEYLMALRNVERLQQSSIAGVADNAKRLLAAAETRLNYWDIAPRDIERLAQTGEVRRTLPLYAPFNGVVTEKMVNQGMFISAGMELYRLADLSRIWVNADIYEYELPWIAQGMVAEVEIPQLGKTIPGKVDLIYPYADGATRTVKARIELPNLDRQLRPDMFVTVRLQGRTVADALLVPSEAVLDSGEQQRVFVALGEGKFDPRPVHVGLRGSNGLVEVHGLHEGEQVVVSAQFMLDSESRLREAIEKMRAPVAAEPSLDDLFE
jgi:Cu(I)/Ag(I) efflux system membrane fusion protein/cobalt-zinc-cadmium efflux system membrane fusion protein